MREWAVRRALLLVLVTACGRWNFDVASPSDSGDDGSGSNFCATLPAAPPPRVCSDFEENQPIATGWTTTITQDKGSLARSDVGNASAHGLAVGFTDQALMTDQSFAYLRYSPPETTITQTRLEFDLELPARPTTRDYEVCDISVQVGAATWFNDLDIGSSGMDDYREEYSSMVGSNVAHLTPFPGLAPGTWHHIAIMLDLANETYSFEVDHAVISAGPSFYPGIAPGSMQYDGGLDFASGVITGNSFNLDNIVIYAQ
jgi:hypothetical protein